MTSRVVKTEADRDALALFIKQQPLPFTTTIQKGAKRSVEQNNLQRLLLNEISEQLGDQTPEEVRGYCKLTLGVPILRAENEIFREKYDKTVKGLPYETKLEIMTEPLDLPVTRIMSVKQKTDYLDAIYRHFGERGLVLTQPEVG